MEQAMLTADNGDAYGPDPAEPALRALYEHTPGTVRLGMIRSTDGRAAGADGSSRSLNGPADLRILRVLRSLADVVVVGGQTAFIEDYADIVLPGALIAARGDGPPNLAIVTRSGLLPSGVTPPRTWVVTTARAFAAMALAPEWASRVLIASEDGLDGRRIVKALRSRGASRVLCEGGPTLAGELLRADVVDDFCLTTSPLRGDPEADVVPAPAPDAVLAHRLHGDRFTMERWVRAPGVPA
jgi:riboflavin biosynthesis pyrimidine reductase